MQLTIQNLKDIISVGIQLTVEKDSDKILNMIVTKGMQITSCEAAIIYLYENDCLKFKIVRTASENMFEKTDEDPAENIPPVPFKEENICAYTAIRRRVVNIPDVYNSEEFDFSGPKKYDTLMGFRTRSMLVIPMENNKGELLGVLQMINARDEQGKVIPFDPQFEMIIRAMGSLSAVELTNIAYVHQIKEQLHSFVEATATIIDERTPYNGTHTRKVAEYSHMLALKINEKHAQGLTDEYFDEERLEKLQLAALLHDIGKMIIPSSIMNRATRLDENLSALEDRYKLIRCYYEIDFLKNRITEEAYQFYIIELDQILDFIHRINAASALTDEEYEKVQEISKMEYAGEEKIPYLTQQETEHLSIRKGTLTAQEREIMESHVVMTSRILSKVYFSKEYEDVPRWAGAHHEFLDGSGYPNHLTAEQLDPETRILTVSDIYDALISKDRPYKKPMSRDKAFEVLHCMVQEGKLEGKYVDWLQEAVAE